MLRAPWRLLGFALIALAAMWTLQFLAAVLQPLADIPPGDPRVLVASFTILSLSLLIAHVVMVRLIDRRDWTWVGLGQQHVAPRPLLLHSILGIVAIGVPTLLLLLVGWFRLEPQPGGSTAWAIFALSTLALLAPAALFEELLFRGYPFAVLREAVGVQATVAVTSVVFALMHFQNPGAGLLPLFVVVLAGVWLAAVLLVTGSLVAAWLAHLAWNWALVGLLHAPVSGFRMAVPGYRLVDAGPEWATGGIWGPEGSIFAALCLALLSWYLFRLWRNRGELAA